MPTTHPTHTTPVSANLAVLRRFVEEILNQGHVAALDELIHDDYCYYGPDGDQISGRDGLQELIAGFRNGFSYDTATMLAQLED